MGKVVLVLGLSLWVILSLIFVIALFGEYDDRKIELDEFTRKIVLHTVGLPLMVPIYLVSAIAEVFKGSK